MDIPLRSRACTLVVSFAVIVANSVFLAAAPARQTQIARRKPVHAAASAPRTQKQIFEVSPTIVRSDVLSAEGVAAYVVSSAGTNRGFLIKDLQGAGGLAYNIGLTAGDVVMNFDSHVVQDGRDIDRILTGMPSGNVRIMFVRPSDSGLQLYNAAFPWVNRGGSMMSSISAGASEKGGHSNSSSNSIEVLAPVESYVIELVNKDRHDNGGLGAVHANGALTGIAREHAKDMCKRGFFAHVNPDGRDPQDRARAAGIKSGVYENIAFQTSSDTATRKVAMSEANFMAEPPNQENHRSNILKPGHVSIGVGVAQIGNKVVMVQEFSDKDP